MELENDYIVRMALGRWNTALITKFGAVWIAGNFQKPKNLKEKVDALKQKSEEPISEDSEED